MLIKRLKCWHFNIYYPDKYNICQFGTRNAVIFQHFSYYEQLKLLSRAEHEKSFITSGPGKYYSVGQFTTWNQCKKILSFGNHGWL